MYRSTKIYRKCISEEAPYAGRSRRLRERAAEKVRQAMLRHLIALEQQAPDLDGMLQQRLVRGPQASAPWVEPRQARSGK